MSQQGVVNIKGKQYKTVALRIAEFRADHSIDSGWGVLCDVLSCNADGVLVSAQIIDPEGRVVAKDYAQEVWTGQINSTSAVENCCTSAIGRCLAAAGLGGENYASAEEVTRAIALQKSGHTNRPAPRAEPVVQPTVREVAVEASPPVEEDQTPVDASEGASVPATATGWTKDNWASYLNNIDDGAVLVSTFASVSSDPAYQQEVAVFTTVCQAFAERGRKLIDKRTKSWKQFVKLLNEAKTSISARAA
jgi:hypothetical protein